MPLPVAIVAWGVGAVVAGVVAKAAHETYTESQHSDHSDYSDAAERRKREEQAREKERRENLRLARKNMQQTLDLVRNTMADAAGAKGEAAFRDWDLSEKEFAYKDFSSEFSALDKDARERIGSALKQTFDAEEERRRQELDEVNELLRRIAQTRLTEK